MNRQRTITSILFTLLALHASAALPIHWDVDLTAQPQQVFTLQRPRGETYELEAVLKNRGKPFEPAITNACIYWQTNGMENLYWSAPASVSNNFLRASWLPSMDPGATTVRGYIGDPGHIYAAAFQFRFIASPGELPNELPLPQKVIDFSKVTVLNPPWSGGGGGGVDTNAVRDIVQPMIASATNDLSQTLKDSISTSTNVIEAQIAALSSSVSGLESSKAEEFTPWVAPSDRSMVGQPVHDGEDPGQGVWLDSNGVKYITVEISPIDFKKATELEFFDLDDFGNRFTATRKRVLRTGDAATPQELTTKQDKITASGVLKGNGSGGVSSAEKSSTSSDPANADYRDPLDNTCHKTEYGDRWIAHNVPYIEAFGYTPTFNNHQPYYYSGDGAWIWVCDQNPNLGVLSYDGSGPDAVSVNFEIDGNSDFRFNATRSAVCTDGKKFVTSDFVDGKVSYAVSTNNPEFVSAVRNTPTSGMPEDMPSDWGTYGTVGAALAALAAFVKWAKAKIVSVIGDDGKPTDTFATDLLGKPVAITAIDARIKTNAESAVEPTNAVTINDNAPKTVTVATVESPATPSLAVTFGTARNGGLRICELYILNGTADTDLTFDSAVNFVSTGDSFPACETGINYFVFAEIAANLWKVTRETLKSITTPTPVAAE